MNILTTISEKIVNSIYLKQCNQVLSSSNPYSRSTELGHITSSGLVIHDNKVLLIFHPVINQWLQPGGHIDDGESPIEAAIREVYEETGFVCILDSDCMDPVDIDIHEIPANPKRSEGTHLHIDLLYRLRVLKEERAIENILHNWLSFDCIENARIQRALDRLGSQGFKQLGF